MMGVTGCSDDSVDSDEMIHSETSQYADFTEDAETDEESEIVDNRIEITFSQDDVYCKHYNDVHAMFQNLGFIDVKFDASEMDYSIKEQFDGAVIGVQIDKKSEFTKGTLFEPEAPILISYVEDLRIQVPKASVDCEGVKYTEIVELFEKAGFTNVKEYGTEIDYTTNVTNQTVLFISVDGNAIFDKSAKFEKDVEVKVHYYIILPAPVQSEQQDNSNINQENDDSGSQEMVWIPKSGKKYHSDPSCSNMKNPSQVTKEEAEDRGYEPCKKCY